MLGKSEDQLKATEAKWSGQFKDCENLDKSKSNEIINKKVSEFLLLQPSVCDCVEMELKGKMDADSKKKCDELQKSMTPEEALKELAECAK